jgi:hypothetical protein
MNTTTPPTLPLSIDGDSNLELVLNTDHLVFHSKQLSNGVPEKFSDLVLCDNCGFYKKKKVLRLNGRAIDRTTGSHLFALKMHECGLHPNPPCSTQIDNLCGVNKYFITQPSSL